MKTAFPAFSQKIGVALFILCFGINVHAQGPRSNFWSELQFAGGFGLGFSRDYTNVLVSPSAIYPVNDYFAAGLGLQGSFVNAKNYIGHSYTCKILGGSLIGLVNPLETIQLSAELEEMHVQQTIARDGGEIKDDFWNTALFLGLGFRSENITIGMRYNVLFKQTDGIYADPYMPFIRLYF